MLGLFGKKKASAPLDQEWRVFFEHNLLWLAETFPNPPIGNRKIWLPTAEEFPVTHKEPDQAAETLFKMISAHLSLDRSRLELIISDQSQRELDTGANPMLLQSGPVDPDFSEESTPISNSSTITVLADMLDEPNLMIATLAHQLVEYKLISEAKIEVWDGDLFDLATIFFGYGIITANNGFRYSQSETRWNYRALASLNEPEWAYGLALLAFMRQEGNPSWKEHLIPGIRKPFDKSLRYMLENESSIFQFGEPEE